MNYLGPFHSRKSRATPFRMTMTAFQSPLRIIFYRSLLSRTCSNSSFRFCLVTPTAVLQGLLHTTAENSSNIYNWEFMPSDINESAKSKHDHMRCILQDCAFRLSRFVLFGELLCFCSTSSLVSSLVCILDSTPGAESDVQTIWLQPPKEWLGKTRIRLDHISICAQSCYFLAVWLFVAICADVCALPLLCFEWAFLGLFVWDV